MQPKKVLVLGVSENFYYLNQNVFDQPTSLNWNEKIGIGKGTIKDKIIEIIVVPHPASFGGNSHKIMSGLRSALGQ
ncbi:MAG: hypothetical protein HQ565_08020 [Bacteroidetes bacterium]|nr:hypothetical protein [Bacteroidota bacterium]